MPDIELSTPDVLCASTQMSWTDFMMWVFCLTYTNFNLIRPIIAGPEADRTHFMENPVLDFFYAQT